MIKRSEVGYPPITQRILSIINEGFNGNVNKFSQFLGLKNSAKINRLFNKDARNDDYPMPSSDIILLISNATGKSTDWLMKGNDDDKTVGSQSISTGNLQGNEELIAIIKKQQEQIDYLMKKILD